MSTNKVLKLLLAGLVSDQDRMSEPPDEWIEALNLLDKMEKEEPVIFQPGNSSPLAINFNYEEVLGEYREEELRNIAREAAQREARERSERLERLADAEEIRENVRTSRSLFNQMVAGEFPLHRDVDET